MQAVLEVVAPVFIIIALGYGAAKYRFIEPAGFKGLNLFTFSLAAPSLLFLGGTTMPGGGGGAALAFFAGTGLLYAFCLWFGGKGLKLPLGEAGLFALNVTFGNTVMMGLPLVLASFGQQALPMLLAIIALHSLVLLGIATIVAEIGLHAQAPWRRVLVATVKGVARNPVVVSVLLALAWRLLQLPPPPGVLRRVLELLGAATPPVALFCLGGSLVGFKAADTWRETGWTVALKLLVMPLLVWAACWLLALSPLETAVTVMIAAMPTGANAFLLAQRYQTAADRSGAAVLIATALSVVTLSVLLGYFRG